MNFMEKSIILQQLQLESQRNIVLATGGGAVTSLRVRDLLKSKFISIFLNVDTETLWARICKNTQIRPLINVPKGKKTMERLFIHTKMDFLKLEKRYQIT